MWATTYEACMTCHYNIHSNVQATNTTYTGGGTQPPVYPGGLAAIGIH